MTEFLRHGEPASGLRLIPHLNDEGLAPLAHECFATVAVHELHSAAQAVNGLVIRQRA